MHKFNWLKIKTSYIFLNFDPTKRGRGGGGFSPPPLVAPLVVPVADTER